MRTRLCALTLCAMLVLLAACDSGVAATPTSVPALPTVAIPPTSAPAASPTPKQGPPTPAAEVYLKIAAATASSFDTTPGFAPSPDALNAADGDLGTRWAPLNGADGQWIRFDFGAIKTLDHLIIHWEDAYATDYDIRVSDDDVTWKMLQEARGQDGTTDEFHFAPTPARYVRVDMQGRKFPEWGTSIWEFEPYGPAAANPGDKPYNQVFAAGTTPTPIAVEVPGPSPGAWGAMDYQKGVNYTSYTTAELAQPPSDETLAYLAQNGVNSIGIVVTWYMPAMSSPDIAPWTGRGGRTVDDGALSHAINTAHRLGLRVMLKPHVDLKIAASRTDLQNPPAAWYSSYTTFISHYAMLAQTYHVELLCIGTEVDGTFPGHGDEWSAIVKAVRAIYSGPLTYAANWPSYPLVTIWPDLDYMGIDAYYPVTPNLDPSAAELEAGWREIVTGITNWRGNMKLEKPVLLTELGYRSAAGSNRQFSAPATTQPAPEQQQAALQAALTVLPQQPWFRGLYYWNALPARNLDDPTGYLLSGKPAEATLFAGFAAWGRTAPPLQP